MSSNSIPVNPKVSVMLTDPSPETDQRKCKAGFNEPNSIGVRRSGMPKEVCQILYYITKIAVIYNNDILPIAHNGIAFPVNKVVVGACIVIPSNCITCTLAKACIDSAPLNPSAYAST